MAVVAVVVRWPLWGDRGVASQFFLGITFMLTGNPITDIQYIETKYTKNLNVLNELVNVTKRSRFATFAQFMLTAAV